MAPTTPSPSALSPPLLLSLLLLLLLHLRPSDAAGPISASNISTATPAIQQFPAERDGWQPALNSSAAWQLPSTATAQRSPETGRQARIFPFFEYLTSRARFIPGLAKNSQCCGKENEQFTFPGGRKEGHKIIGGDESTLLQYPWMVVIYLFDELRSSKGGQLPKNGFGLLCGGVLLNDRYVLTSCDCVTPYIATDLAALLGFVVEGAIYTVRITQIISHPDFNPTTKENDIALLKMERVLSLPVAVNFIAPICLPHRSKYTDEKATVVGYGFINEQGESNGNANTVNLLTISNRRCGDFLGEDTIEKSMICAGAKNIGAGGMGPCTLDFGGPLMVRTWYDRDRFTLIGIATNRTGCGQPGVPAVFTRVYSFLDWLLDNMEDATYC